MYKSSLMINPMNSQMKCNIKITNQCIDFFDKKIAYDFYKFLYQKNCSMKKLWYHNEETICME